MISRILIVLLLPALLLVSTGCAGFSEAMATSKQSREEGMRLVAEKDYAHAVGAFRNAVKQEPRDIRSHYCLGVCYEELGQYHQAMDSYRTALTIKPCTTLDEDVKLADLRPQMIDSLAKCIAAHDDRDIEFNACDARARASKTGESYLILAKIARYRQDPDSALRAYHQAAIYDPTSFAIYKEYGLYLLDSLSQARDAEPALRRAYALNNTDKQVNDALRRLNVIPGPSLKDSKDMARPMIPSGPIPEVDLTKLFNGNSPDPANNPPAGASSSVQSPRD